MNRARRKSVSGTNADYVESIGNRIRYDINRESRIGFPEIVLAEGKRDDDISSVIKLHLKQRKSLIISRIDSLRFQKICSLARISEKEFTVYGEGNVVVYRGERARRYKGHVAVVTAGTADIAVALQSIAILEFFGIKHDDFFDCGIAGMHRAIYATESIINGDYDAVLVFAGMEGALASVIASLVPNPVVGVPVSVGYGRKGGGEAALDAMLQSCVPGLAVVNIDNGIGAAAVVMRIIAGHAGRNK